MKKPIAKTLLLFFLSVIINNAHRAWRSAEMIQPFLINDLQISVAWYAKLLCDMISFTLIMMCICFVLQPVESHMKNSEWKGHNAIYIFVKVWHRVFWVVVVISVLDIAHYLLSFRQTEWFFLVQNGIFFIMTSYYLYKAYRK